MVTQSTMAPATCSGSVIQPGTPKVLAWSSQRTLQPVAGVPVGLPGLGGRPLSGGAVTAARWEGPAKETPDCCWLASEHQRRYLLFHSTSFTVQTCSGMFEVGFCQFAPVGASASGGSASASSRAVSATQRPSLVTHS